jgi:anti-sigma B factor antagonist
MNTAQQSASEVRILKIHNKRIDAAAAGEFRQKLGEVVEKGNTRFVLDLSDVELMDSTGLGALVAALKASSDAGRVVIAGAQGAVATLFKITRMDQVFRLYPTTVEAAAAFKRASGK